MSAAPSFRDSPATADVEQAGLLYERYAGRLLAFCRSRLGSREDAEDAVQQTFLNAHRSLRSGTVPHAEAAWMFAIAANVCRERHRSAWRRSRVEVVSDDGLVGEQAAPEHPHDELSGVADALAELTPNQRRAILMREWQGLSYREIAGELAVSECAVETLIFRARRSLARKLDRSRGSIWGISNLGSAFAWGKAVLGGTAAQVAAATLAVGAGLGGVAAVVPMHGSAAGEVVALGAAPKAPSTRRTVANRRIQPEAVAKGHLSKTIPRTRPSVARAPAPAPSTAPTRPVAAEPTAPAPPAAPPVAAPRTPIVTAEPPPPLPKVEVPPIPPLPPASAPSVPLPALPDPPKLP